MLKSDVPDTFTPRDALEEQENPDMHDELAAAFGRVLTWLLRSKNVEHVGFRAYVLAYKLRPDLIHGMTFADIGAMMGQGRSHAHNLSHELTLIFGLRGRNEQSDDAKKKHQKNWAKSHRNRPREDLTAAHLPLVNRFAQWQAALERAGIDPTEPAQAARLRQDFAPLLRFAQRLENHTAPMRAG